MPLILLILKIYIKIKISKVYKFDMRILAIQNRMGIGDTVIFLPYIEKISEKFNTPIDLLVKKSSKADQFLSDTKYINEIIFLERDNKKLSRHNGIMGSLRLIKDLKKYKFDKVFIFNSSLRYNLITRLSGIKEIYQYPLFKKKNQLINKPAIDLIKKKLNLVANKNPKIEVDKNLEKLAIHKYNIDKNNFNILLGIGGSGPTKRIPANTFLSVIKKINSIKNCNVSICNDTSFSHLSSALGIKTITLMADTPLIYGSYSLNMYPIIPDGEITVGHDTLGKDKINPAKIYDKLMSIIS